MNKELPPHLPKKTEQVFFSKNYQHIIALVLTIVIAFLSGIAGSLVIIQKYFPERGTSQTILTLKNEQEKSAGYNLPAVSVLDSQVAQRIVRIFDGRKKVLGTAYPKNSFIGEAVLLTSDGWAVVYQKRFLEWQYANWEVVDFQGKSYRIEKNIYDRNTGLTYIKIDGEDFRSDIKFASESSVEKAGVVWVVAQTNRIPVLLGENISVKDDNSDYTIFDERFRREILADIEPGKIIMNEKGELYGFSDENGTLVEAREVAGQLNQLTQGGSPQYYGLPVSGYEVEVIRNQGDSVNELGLYVYRGTSVRPSTSTVVAGDIIIEVNGEPYSPERIRGQIFSSSERDVQMTVLRNDTLEGITIKTQKLAP